MKTLAIACVLATACVRPATPAKFADRPIVTRIDDRRPIAEPGVNSSVLLADVMVFDPIINAFDRPKRSPAADVNALDEVPDSTWFENRIGVRTITPEEAARGPDNDGPPVLPLQVVKAKPGGTNPGFVAADARGKRYIVKFDTKENPELQTATDSIVGRILWAAGYHTPAEFVVFFRRDQVTLSAALKAKGTIKDVDLDRMVKSATRSGDLIRASASAFLPGKPKGGWDPTGTRADDANDRVPHERRRVLRGLKVLCAWLNHTDMKQGNSLDIYVGEPGQGHIVHYLVDFGEAFSGHQSETQNPRIGYEHGWDYGAQAKAMVSFGLVHGEWEKQVKTPWPSIGWYGPIAFDPWDWRERYPYAPFALAERADLYWGAKLVMRFDRAQLTAIVETGRLSEPRAAAYLVETLLARRIAIGRAFLDAVTPLEELALSPGQLCGVDLARKLQIEGSGELELSGRRYAIRGDGAVCAALDTRPGYHVVKAKIRRNGRTTPALEIHYIGGEQPRIIGLVR